MIPLLKSIRNIAKIASGPACKCKIGRLLRTALYFSRWHPLCDGESGEVVASTALRETIHYAIKTSTDAAQTFEQCVGYDALIEAMRINEEAKVRSLESEVDAMTSIRFACDDDNIDEKALRVRVR